MAQTTKIMSEEKITKNNSIMAEFLGFKKELFYQLIEDGNWTDKDYGFYDLPFDNGTSLWGKNNIWFEQTKLKFHTDWNWLMKIVDKIESLGFDVEISSKKGFRPDLEIPMPHICDITSKEHGNIEMLIGTSKIAIVYGTCLHFIKWFNQQ